MLDFVKSCSHLIHIHSLSALPKGLRLEISFETDKKKPEIFFGGAIKKILTENQNKRPPGDAKMILLALKLTELVRSRIFAAFEALLAAAPPFEMNLKSMILPHWTTKRAVAFKSGVR